MYYHNYKRHPLKSPAQNPTTAFGMTVSSVALGTLVMYWNHAHRQQDPAKKWVLLATGGALVSVAQEIFRSKIGMSR
jgi:hypothetical protein